jgi:PAB-dependent poly(A)-specific ribonuclease subunit 2
MKVAQSEGSDGEWIMFNDFSVRPVFEEEVFSFPAQWKVGISPFGADERHPRSS